MQDKEIKSPSGGERLAPGPQPETAHRARGTQAPASAVAAALARLKPTQDQTLVHLASSDRRAEEIGRALASFVSELEIIVLPPWDCLPYDRASPSRDVMGRRLEGLRRLATAPGAGRVVVLSPEALVQKTPPRQVLTEAIFNLHVGAALDRAALIAFATRCGYVFDDRIDEPGEIALLGGVIDIYPAEAARPVRIVVDEADTITELRLYDPLSQRSEGEIDSLSLGPASELIYPASQTPTPSEIGAPAPRMQGLEHGLAAHYGELESLFDILGGARLTVDEKASMRLTEVQDYIAEAFEARASLGGLDAAPPGPQELYLLGDPLAKALTLWNQVALDLEEVEPVSNLAQEANPGRAFCTLVEAYSQDRQRVVLTGIGQEQRALARTLARELDLTPKPVESWSEALMAQGGAVLALTADLDAGFIDPANGLVVLAAADVFGGRIAQRQSGWSPALTADADLRIGDLVLHEDHGVAILRDLRRVPINGVECDTLALEYHGGAALLTPIEEIGRIWRYGAEASAVSLDRLNSGAWAKRRAELSRHIDETAARLVQLAKAREDRKCSPITPPKAAFARFAARFAYPETPDQAAAIQATLADLASGRPMDRLICGDVGFGKTEVALRAAAAVALSGRQVALAAPTTVLARQHVETFRRRFQGSGVGVAHLSRLVTPAEARQVRKGLEDGEIHIVIGTQALANKDLVFDDLGLMIIDEEQKFGAAIKAHLRDLTQGGHLLTLTATPIPRTLRAAMVGVQAISIIASPPARRRPIRTFLAPFDPASLRTALMREKRRGGQSFMVAPRIEDIAPLAQHLAQWAPELRVVIAHGGLTPDEADTVMVGFSEGEGDVLLATNIIESGLDVPRANTMIVWRPDRFGLSQLHQLRGRVGRGRVQGVAYLLSDPDHDLSEAARARLSTLEAFDRLGSGLAISVRDLDLRGGGDLVGEEQAGHMKMVGAALYQRLLERALRAARGEQQDHDWSPVIKVGEGASIPTDYVPDPVARINLHSRLARLETAAQIDAFEEELEDRFGPPPPAVALLLNRARLQALAKLARVRHVSAGPKGVLFLLEPGAIKAAPQSLLKLAPQARLEGEKLSIPLAIEDEAERRAMVETLLFNLTR